MLCLESQHPGEGPASATQEIPAWAIKQHIKKVGEKSEGGNGRKEREKEREGTWSRKHEWADERAHWVEMAACRKL